MFLPSYFQMREDDYINAEELMHRDFTSEEHESHRIQLPFVNMKHSDTIPIFDHVLEWPKYCSHNKTSLIYSSNKLRPWVG